MIDRERRRAAEPKSRRTEGGNPTWYKEAIIYELHVRTFHESDRDGIGDSAGQTT